MDFIWHGIRKGELIWERLDRGVANYEWLAKFPMGRIKHLNCFTLNYRPILLSLDENVEHQKWRQKPFHFKAMWVKDPGCKEIITRAWDCTPDGTPMYVATTKLKRCKKHLKAWSQDHFANILRKIKIAKEPLWRAEEASANSRNLEEIVYLKKELNSLYDKEENMWQQRFQIQ